jgi:HEAT repeat protein
MSGRRAVALAGHTGDAATARVALAADDPAVRAIALGSLERLGALDDAMVTAALVDESPVVRRRACELAAGRPDVSLLAALDDADDGVVEVSAFACGERAAASLAVLRRLAALATDHVDALVRESAVAALGALGDPIGLPAILVATRDKPAVRRRAVIALAPFDGPEVDAALAAASSDRDWQVRQAAEDLSD